MLGHVLVAAALLVIGDPLPPLELTTLDGKPATIARPANRITVIDFFATWCGPCRRSLPAVERLRAAFGDRVDFVSIDEDDDPAVVPPFVASMKMTTRVLYDRDRRAYHQLGAHTLPTTYIIDRQGIVRKINHGYGAGYEARMTQWLDQLLR